MPVNAVTAASAASDPVESPDAETFVAVTETPPAVIVDVAADVEAV
jgi:hypothetical protein